MRPRHTAAENELVYDNNDGCPECFNEAAAYSRGKRKDFAPLGTKTEALQ